MKEGFENLKLTGHIETEENSIALDKFDQMDRDTVII